MNVQFSSLLWIDHQPSHPGKDFRQSVSEFEIWISHEGSQGREELSHVSLELLVSQHQDNVECLAGHRHQHGSFMRTGVLALDQLSQHMIAFLES